MKKYTFEQVYEKAFKDNDVISKQDLTLFLVGYLQDMLLQNAGVGKRPLYISLPEDLPPRNINSLIIKLMEE